MTATAGEMAALLVLNEALRQENAALASENRDLVRLAHQLADRLSEEARAAVESVHYAIQPWTPNRHNTYPQEP